MFCDFAIAKHLNTQKKFFIPHPRQSRRFSEQVANFSQEAFMRELDPIGREGEVLLLVGEDGERFSVVIDETLMRTLKENRVPDVSGQQLSPREIQDAVRAGESITQIAERSGTSLSLVERFAHPVIEELQHMVDLALSIRVELPANRFNEVSKKPFGDVVFENLVALGGSQIVWRAKRGESSIWELIVQYELAEKVNHATWSFDPRRYQLTPENSNAQALSKPTPVVDDLLASTSKNIESPLHPPAGEPVVTADKLQAFRSRRAKAETEQITIAEVISITPAIETVPEDLGEESQEAEVLQSEDTQIAPTSDAPKKSRAPMPSWDQIVRGTQSDDGEAF
jgi:hypothetical protein